MSSSTCKRGDETPFFVRNPALRCMTSRIVTAQTIGVTVRGAQLAKLLLSG